MLKVKDWIKNKSSGIQFEIIDVPDEGYPGQPRRAARRIKDDKIFDVGCLVRDQNNILWVLIDFNEDCIHCRTSNLSFNVIDGKTKTEYNSIQQEINNIEKENVES